MLMSARHYPLAAVALIVACLATPAAAQTGAGNQGAITLTGGVDFVNAYMFRGIRQDDTRMIVWPFAEAAVRLHSGTEGLRTVSAHIGTWNSLHTGLAGIAGPSGKLWYESDFYTTLALGFAHGVSLGTTFTAYTSPNNSFTSIKEIAFKAALDDSAGGFSGVSLKPYGLVAFEFDTSPGVGQADGGFNRGTYLEIGVAPGWTDPGLSISFPVKIGLSLKDYYELAGIDQRFGFLSIGALGTLPLASSARYGAWNLHGGVEFQSLGNTPEAFNGGDQSKLIASIGIGFTY